MKTIGLVTVLYNCAEVLEDFFTSLAAQTDPNWYLYIIDNSPDDRAANVALNWIDKLCSGKVSIHRNQENIGVAAANNIGINKCLEDGLEYIVLLNNDVVLNPLLLYETRQALDEGHYLVAPRIVYHDTGYVWYAGGYIRTIAATVHHLNCGKPVSVSDLANRGTFFATTCFLAFRSSVFSTVGLMDERYFVYYDDTDFVFRCLKAGFKPYYLGNASLRHKVSSSTGGGQSLFSTYYYNRNRLIFIRKHRAGGLLFLSLFWYILTRAYVFCRCDSSSRQVLVGAIKDGWREVIK